MEENKNKKKIDALTVLGYIVGGIFGFVGIVGLFTDFILGLTLLIAGAALFPPLWKYINKKANVAVSRGARIVLFLVVIALGGGLSISGQDTNKHSGTPATDTTTGVTETQQTPVEEPKEPIVLTGNGQQATELFTLDKGLIRFKISHAGEGHFAIWLMDDAGNDIELLVNTIGSFDGSKAVKINKNGQYLLNVSAEGPWNVSIEN